MEAEATQQAEGWLADPYGRHELRFFDGHRWTPYVRDGGENGVDEPGDPLAELVHAAARTGLLSEEVLVVQRFTDLGRRWSDRTVHRGDGGLAGKLRRAAPGVDRPHPGMSSLVLLDHVKSDVVELVDDKQTVVLTLISPMNVARTLVEVRDSEGRDAGRIVQQNPRSGETTYAFLGPNGSFLGDLQAENWVAWDLRVFDNHARQVATITRDWEELDLTSFPRPDDYVVRISQPMHEPLRTLVVAAAISLEVAVRPDPRGS